MATSKAPAPDAPTSPPAPLIPHLPDVAVWEAGRAVPGRVLAVNQDGTLEISVTGLAPHPITLHGVHRRQDQGTGWAPKD